MLKSAPIVFLLAAGCGGQVAPDNQAKPVQAASQPAVARPVPPPPPPVKIDEEGALLDFHLEWPSEVSAIPALAGKLRSAAMAHKAELTKMASNDKAQRAKDGFPFNTYEFSEDFEVEGNSGALLSVTDNWYEFTGGAHPNHGTKAILWDRKNGRQIAFADLFDGGAAKVDALFHPAYCAALDKARAEERGPEDSGGPADDPFNQCPRFAELALITAGTAGKPMTKLSFHADPYVAGPYVEGDYDIELPVTAPLLAALKPQYRSSFALP